MTILAELEATVRAVHVLHVCRVFVTVTWRVRNNVENSPVISALLTGNGDGGGRVHPPELARLPAN